MTLTSEVIMLPIMTNITLTKEECQIILAYYKDYVPTVTERQRDIYRNFINRLEDAVRER